MLILGHTGITLGAAVLLSGAVTAVRHPTASQEEADLSPDSPQLPETTGSPFSLPGSWLTSLARHVDIRLLLIGSLLPDIIDKPLGHIFLRESLSSGRTFAHSLLFLIIIALAGLLLYLYKKKTWLLVLSFGTLMHLTLDQIWNNPKTMLWPFLGSTFQKSDLSNYLANTVNSLTTNYEVYIPEIIGGLILVWFAWEVWRRRRLLSLIKYGRI